MILRKHLSQDECQVAINEQALTKLQLPNLRSRLKERLYRIQHPKVLSNALQLMRRERQLRRLHRSDPQAVDFEPYIKTFLEEFESVDYEPPEVRAA